MLRRIIRRQWYICGILPFDLFPHQDNVDSKDSRVSFYKQKSENETGWNRLYMMYTLDEFGNMSPEVNSSFQATFLGTFIGVCYGGINNSKMAYVNFMERNEATVFKNHLEAKKKLQDKVTVGFAKGAFRWGWRLGLFTGLYLLATTTISVYRGHSSMMEYVVAGGITGAVFKLNLGLRGIAVGGGLGAILGSFAGMISLILLKVSGMTMEEVRYWQYHWQDERNRSFFKADKDKEAGKNPLLVLHDKKVGPSGKSLEALDSVSSPPTPQDTKSS